MTRLIDERAGLTMNTSDRVRPKSRYRAKTLKKQIVCDRIHDARHAGHVKLEGANAVFFCVARNFLDLLGREDLRMKDRIDIAPRIHRSPEDRQMIEIGLFQAAKENAD